MSKCNCYKERLEKVKQAISKKREGVKDLELEWVGRTYNLSGRDVSPVTPKIEFSYFKPKKCGGFRANRTKEEVYIEAKFCAFCGREYGKED